jgi:hypothetical protein
MSRGSNFLQLIFSRIIAFEEEIKNLLEKEGCLPFRDSLECYASVALKGISYFQG